MFLSDSLRLLSVVSSVSSLGVALQMPKIWCTWWPYIFD